MAGCPCYRRAALVLVVTTILSVQHATSTASSQRNSQPLPYDRNAPSPSSSDSFDFYNRRYPSYQAEQDSHALTRSSPSQIPRYLASRLDSTGSSSVLKTSPLTSPGNKSTLGLYSKWGSEKRDIGPRSNSIESSLAAIFRGVAYGAPSTTSTTTTTTTTTATSTTTTTEKPKVVQNLNPSLEDSIGESPKTSDSHGENSDYHTDGSIDDAQIPIIPTSITTTAFPNEVRRAGIDEWQSSLEGAWEVHVYCSAASFSILALMSLLCIVRVNMSNYLLPRSYYVTAHLLVFLSSSFRCIFFFRDPYASGGKLPSALSDVLFNTGIPCITAAFSVVVLALLNCARIILLPMNLQSPLVFGVISCIYIFSNVIVDILAGVFSQLEWTGALRASVQALTAGWTAAMCLGFMIIFYRIEKVAARQRNELMRYSYGRDPLDTPTLSRRIPAFSLSRAARLILVSSLCGLTVAVLQVYGLMTPDGLIHLPPKEPWMWFGFQTSCRLLEIIMWSCICVAAALTSCSSIDKESTDERSLTVFSCKNCTSCSDLSSCHENSSKKVNEDLYPTVCQTNLIVRNYSVDLNGKMMTEDGRTLPHLTNTIGPKEKDKTNKKTSTLHSATSDMHLLWGGQYSTSTTSRPASMIFNENGMVRFRTQVDGSEYHDNQRGIYGNEEMPPGYSEQVYNMSQHKNNDLSNEGNDPQLQQLIQNNKVPKDIYGRSRDNEFVQLTSNDKNTEYNYPELPNDEYARYASACSSVSAANSFDVRMYDDYEVASYYHSPINGPKSIASQHVYASLRPVHTQLTGNKFQQRNTRVPTNNSCFSSPQSGVSSTHTNQSPRLSNQHTSDSDLCSSATDRTHASSSHGNDDNNEKYDNMNLNFCRPQMRRHLSHPNAIPDQSALVPTHNRERFPKTNGNNEYIENQYSPSDSDDIYTPLMDQHQQFNCPTSSPMLMQDRSFMKSQQHRFRQHPNSFDKSQKISNSLHQENASSFFSGQNEQNLPRTVQNTTFKSEIPSAETTVPVHNLSPRGSNPSSPVYLNNEVEQSFNVIANNPAETPMSLSPRARQNQNNATINKDLEENKRDVIPRVGPPPIPQRPSLAETWVHQPKDGLPRTEFVRKGSQKQRSPLSPQGSNNTVTNI